MSRLSSFASLLKPVIDLVFPPICHACREFITDSRKLHICDNCLSSVVPIESPLCICCGTPFRNFGGGDHLCGVCSSDHPGFAAARSAVAYQGVTRDLIHSFKYSGKILLRTPLAMISASHLDSFVAGFSPETVLPVPLHKKRLGQRGFNQALLLGEIFARRWSAPLQRNNLQRIRWTEPQVNLKAEERHANVKGAFALAAPERLSGRRVLLVDDVYTTGSTVKECARVLIDAGAAEVAVVTVARAVEQIETT